MMIVMITVHQTIMISAAYVMVIILVVLTVLAYQMVIAGKVIVAV